VNMNPNNRDVTDEDIGRRAVEIRRERAVERALERLRKGVAADWRRLTVRDVERLRWALGELWGYVPHSEWDDLHFSSRNYHDVHGLLEMAAELAQTHTEGPILDRMAAALQ
jgi:hypothetical protein